MKDSSKKQTASTGIGFLVAIVFIVLKLLGKITWSWWWVLAPVWMPLAIVLGIFLIARIVGTIAATIAS